MKQLVAGFTLAATLAYSGHSEAAQWKSFSGDPVIEQRVDSVLSLMTLEEKIGQMVQYSCNWDVTGPIMTDDFEPYLKKRIGWKYF